MNTPRGSFSVKRSTVSPSGSVATTRPTAVPNGAFSTTEKFWGTTVGGSGASAIVRFTATSLNCTLSETRIVSVVKKASPRAVPSTDPRSASVDS